MTDAVRVRQIVTNGLTNALKYAAPATYGPLRVVCAAGPAAGGSDTAAGPGAVLIEVLDSGLGLQGQTEESLFEDFAAHVPTSRTGAVGSSGLGLAICNRMARLLGGRLHVTDRVDGVHGTRFVLSLPLRGPPEAAAAAAVEAPSTVAIPVPANAPVDAFRESRPPLVDAEAGRTILVLGPPPADGAGSPHPKRSPPAVDAPASPAATTAGPPLGLHVLLVDDSVGNRRVGARMLAALGCTCETASDGDEVRRGASTVSCSVLLHCATSAMRAYTPQGPCTRRTSAQSAHRRLLLRSRGQTQLAARSTPC